MYVECVKKMVTQRCFR